MRDGTDSEPLFDGLYAHAMAALRELPRAHVDRPRAAAALAYLLLNGFPHCFDERVERELATYVLAHLDEHRVVMPMLECLTARRHRTDVTPRIVRKVLELTHRDGHGRLLVQFLLHLSEWREVPADLDPALVRAAAERATMDEPSAAATILAAWAERAPERAPEIRTIIAKNPRVATLDTGAPCLFLIAPSQEGARAWAERVDRGVAWLDVADTSYGTDRLQLVHAVRDALDVERDHATCAVLSGWLDELLGRTEEADVDVF